MIQEIRNLGNFDEIQEMSGIDGDYPASHLKGKF